MGETERKIKKIFFKWLLIIGIICNIDRIIGADINIVLVTETGEEGAELAQNVVSKAATKVEGFNVIPVSITAELGEEKICDEIFKDGKVPSLVFDATLKPYGMSTGKLSTSLKNVLRKMAVPTVSASYGPHLWETPLTAAEAEYFVQIPPPGDSLISIVKDLASGPDLNLNMKSAAVLFDNNFEIVQKSSTLLANLPVSLTMQAIKGTEIDDIESKLKGLQGTKVGTVFVAGNIGTLNNAVKAIQSLRMFKKQYSYFFLTKEDTKLSSCADCVNASILLMQPVQGENGDFKNENFPSPQKVDSAFYYDVTILLLKVLKQEEANFPMTLTFPKCADMTLTPEMKEERAKFTLLTALKQTSISGAYGKFVFKDKQNYQELKLGLNKNFLNDSKITTTMLAEWQYGSNNAIKMIGTNTLTDFKSWLMLKVTTVVQPPFVYYDEKTKMFTGYCIELIDAIKEIVGFDYTISEPDDKLFGTMGVEDGKVVWNGMIEELRSTRADIALAPLSVMAERETVVDFTVPYYDLVGISILMKKPQVQSSLFKFLTVLETNVWGCILGAYFFTSFLMYLFDRLSPYSFHNNREKYKDDEEKRDFNIKECMWFCMTSLTPQGGGEAPRNLSGRLVAATWWLFGFIIIASYTANLAAFLTVSRLDSTIESLDDLAKQYKVKYAPQNGSSSQTYFERMAHIEERFYEIWKNMSLDDSLNETERAKLAVWDYPVSDKYTKIWWTMSEAGFPVDFDTGISQVRDSKGPQDGFAFIADSTQVKYAVMTHCDLIQVGNEFSRKPLALAVQQSSPLKDQLSSAILKLLNQRKLESLKEAWWNKNPYKVECDDSDKQSDGISIANIGGVFIVIFIGVVLACITLAIEYWYYKQKRKTTRVVAIKEYGGHNKDPIKR